MPNKTKTKIKEAEEFFAKEIYLISETKKWNVIKYQKDPLIIGIRKKQTYLINAFNCTPLEEFIKSTYVEPKENRN